MFLGVRQACMSAGERGRGNDVQLDLSHAPASVAGSHPIDFEQRLLVKQFSEVKMGQTPASNCKFMIWQVGSLPQPALLQRNQRHRVSFSRRRGNGESLSQSYTDWLGPRQDVA